MIRTCFLVSSFLLVFYHAEAGKSSPIRTASTLQFAENKGQWPRDVQFISDLSSGKLIARKNSLSFLMWGGGATEDSHHLHSDSPVQAHLFRINFSRSNIACEVAASEKEFTYRNYFIGNDPAHWASRVGLFKKISYRNLWAGTDANFYGSGDALKYDFRIRPNSDATKIKLQYEGVSDLKIAEGEIKYKTSLGEFRELAPYAFQNINDRICEVKCAYVLNTELNTVSFYFPDGYDHNYELVIDPTLIFSSYTGATADNWGYTATYDEQENLYVGGYVNAADGGTYPTTAGAFQLTWGGGTGGNSGGGNGNGIGFSCDMGITKFTADGTQLIYSTYIGGSDNETPHSLIVDNSGNLIIYGVSYSTNYPVSTGAYDVSPNGRGDIVVTKLNSSGSALIGSTYIGGSLDDGINFDPLEFTAGNLKWNYGDQNRGEVVIDMQDNIYVASCTKSNNFPVSSGAAQTTFGGNQDGCIFKLNPTCQSLIFSTFLGDTADDACYSLDLTAGNEVYACGGTMSATFHGTSGTIHSTYAGGLYDGFVTHLNAGGTQFLQTTLIGTTGDDQVYFVKLDKAGNVYFVGRTTGAYPIISGGFSPFYSNPNSGQFICKVRPDLSAHIYSTVFGNGNGTPNISPTAFLVDTCENIYVAGWGTDSPSFIDFPNDMSNMPLSADATQTTTDGTDFYFFVLQKNAQSLLYASYFGGNGADEHVDGGTSRFDKRGVIYEAICAGCGGNSLTPTTPGVWSPTNQSSNCNELGLKLAFNLTGTHVELNAFPRATGCVPLTVQFNSIGSTTLDLKWDFDDGDTSILANPVHTFVDTGIYHVMLVGTDLSSCNIHDTAYLDVIVGNDSLIANFLPGMEVNCDSNLIRLSSLNYPTTTYVWNLGDGFVSTNDSVTHTYQNAGTYTITLVITDSTKCNLRDTFVSQVTILPKVNAQFSMSDSAGCVPLPVNFIIQPMASANYYWTFGDGSTSILPTPTHTYNSGGTFQVRLIVVDSASCNFTDSAFATVMTIDSSADADFHFIRTFYGCDSVRITAWSTYTGEEAEFWDLGDGSQSTNDTISHVYATAGSFTITHIITDLDVICRQIDTSQIILSLQPLDISITVPDTGGCLPFLASFIGNTPLLTTDFYWTYGDGALDSGNIVSHTYTRTGTFNVKVVAIDTNACVGADSAFAQITVIDDSVHADFNLTVLNDCDSNLVIDLVNQSTNAVQNFWDFGDGTTSSQVNENHTYTQPGTYSVMLTVTDTSRCHPVDTILRTVTLLPNAYVDFTAPDVCAGTGVQFNNLSNPNAQFIWHFDDGNTSGIYSPLHNYASSGNYDVSLIIIDSSTCNVHDTAFHSVAVSEQPIAGFYTQGDTFKYETPIEFTNTSEHYDHLLWEFGDGISLVDEENPVHVYAGINGMTICLTATNGSCADTVCKNIFISFKVLVGVPNAFTPNGDGINDVVRIEGTGIVDLVFRIFNRWGEKVFETHDKAIGWDGIYKGELQEMEVYTYSAEALMINEETVRLKGNITLLR